MTAKLFEGGGLRHGLFCSRFFSNCLVFMFAQTGEKVKLNSKIVETFDGATAI
jgi:hypothetical protein